MPPTEELIMNKSIYRKRAEAAYAMATWHAALGIFCYFLFPLSQAPFPLLLIAVAALLVAKHNEDKMPNRDRNRNRDR